MKEIKIGFVDRTVVVFIPDPASTDGSGKTGLVAANMTVSYTRVETDNDVVVTDATSSLNDLANLTAAHNDWGWFEVSSTLAPGLYRLDCADAVFASGAWTAVVYVMITTSAAAASPIEFSLVAFDPLDGVRMGLTGLANAVPGAAGGLFIAGTNAATAITTALTSNIIGNVTGNLSGSVGSVTGAVGSVTGAVGSVTGNVGGNVTGTVGSVVGAVGSVTGNVGGNVTGTVGSVVGAVGSVTGAVGSVTGNVGGNVTGSVGSVAAGGIAAASFAAGAIDATAIAANAIGASELAADAVAEIADGILDRDMSTGVDSGSTTVRTPRQALRFLRNAWAIAAGTLTVKKEDDSTTSWTAAVTGTAGADPVTSTDPAGP